MTTARVFIVALLLTALVMGAGMYWLQVYAYYDELSPEEAAKRAPDYLMAEIGPRIAKEPARFTVQAQLAAAGDPTNDATKPWPDDRTFVDLGVLTVSKVVPDSAEAEKALLFMPNALTDGVEVSDDPLIDARVQAYAVSFGRRSQ